MDHFPDRDEALGILKEFTRNEGLIKHALAVEGVMRYMARKHGEDEVKWGVVGLVHDLDYELYPNEHCRRSGQILRDREWPAEYIRAVVSHGWGVYSDQEPLSLMERTLYTIDELTGLVAAAALVRPSRSVMDLEARSVMKKWKDRSFAAGVDRSVIASGAEMLGMDLRAVITDTIMGMREVADNIDL